LHKIHTEKQPQPKEQLTLKQKRIKNGESRLMFGNGRGMKEAHLVKIGDDYIPIPIKRKKPKPNIWNI